MTLCYLCKKQTKKSQQKERFVHAHCLNELERELRQLIFQTRVSRLSKMKLADDDVVYVIPNN